MDLIEIFDASFLLKIEGTDIYRLFLMYKIQWELIQFTAIEGNPLSLFSLSREHPADVSNERGVAFPATERADGNWVSSSFPSRRFDLSRRDEQHQNFLARREGRRFSSPWGRDKADEQKESVGENRVNNFREMMDAPRLERIRPY